MDRLKNSLPLAMNEMGGERFSSLAGQYIRDEYREHSDLLEDFILYLVRVGAPPHGVVVALFELARLQCADIGPRPLSIVELQTTPVSRLLTMRIVRHPAARAVEVAGQVPTTLLELYPNLEGADGILLSRRVGGHLVLPLAIEELAMFRRLAQPQDLAKILGAEEASSQAPSTFHRLVKLGVVIEVRSGHGGSPEGYVCH